MMNIKPVSKQITCAAVVLNYNHGNYMAELLPTLARQTNPFDEIIVVDDASTDDSVVHIEAAMQGISHARLMKNPVNLGVNASCNAAAAALEHDFIYFIAADDQYRTTMLEAAAPLIEAHPNLGMVSGNSCTYEEVTGRERAFVLPFPQVPAVYDGAVLADVARRQAVTFFGGANLFRREALLAAGGFPLALKWHADWFLYLVLARRFGFGVIPVECVRFTLRAGQYSEACYDWSRQRPVIEAFLRLIRTDYADQYDFFRNGALLPVYNIQTLWLLISEREFRHFLTPLLVWRLLSYWPLRAVAKLMSPRLKNMLRKFLRV